MRKYKVSQWFLLNWYLRYWKYVYNSSQKISNGYRYKDNLIQIQILTEG